MGALLFFVCFLAVYFLPAFLGRNKKNSQAILVLNLLLGWTGLGWVVCIVWASMKD